MNNNEVPAAKSLRWLAMQFPKVENPQDNADKLQNCINLYCTNAAYLIECQNAEIERLKVGEYRHISKTLQNARIEAIEEFAEKLKDAVDEPREIEGEVIDFIIDRIDSLVKEMMEDKDVQK